MNVLFLTSSMIDSDFTSYQDEAKIKPNPSNQYFFSKLIRAVGKYNNVAVISHRPFARGMFKKPRLEKDQNSFVGVRYYYTKIGASLHYKLFEETKEIINTSKYAIESFLSEDFIIVVDTLRLSLLKAAISLSKQYHVKAVGMLTDNPFNLSNANNYISRRLTKYTSKLDAYLSLTKGLVSNYGNKPHYVFEGLVDKENGVKKDFTNNYIFFGGSLYERYGVKTLVDAFHKSMCNFKLVIAGNGPLSKYIDKIADEDSRILCLSQLSHEKVIGYEMNALANINPRPINERLDNESVPSKVFEYFSIGVPVISTKHKAVYDLFKENVFWIEEDTIDSFVKTFEKFENRNFGDASKKALAAKTKAFEFYSLEIQGESISHFLTTLK